MLPPLINLINAQILHMDTTTIKIFFIVGTKRFQKVEKYVQIYSRQKYHLDLIKLMRKTCSIVNIFLQKKHSRPSETKTKLENIDSRMRSIRDHDQMREHRERDKCALARVLARRKVGIAFHMQAATSTCRCMWAY